MHTEKLIENAKQEISEKQCKILLIARGISGCGKSFFGSIIVASMQLNGLSAVQLEADDFYTEKESGKYNFTTEKRATAHADCFARFCKAVEEKVNVIALTNVSSQVEEFEKYQKLAEKNGYKVISAILENRRDGQDEHGITDEKKEWMLENFQQDGSIKLK